MTEDRTPAEHLEGTKWHLGKRILFRLAFCYLVLYYLPSVLNVIPGAQSLAGLYNFLWDRAISWGLVHLLNIDPAQASIHGERRYTPGLRSTMRHRSLCSRSRHSLDPSGSTQTALHQP